MANMSGLLRPCPFCGSEIVSLHLAEEEGWNVRCDLCDGSAFGLSEREATDSWNQRALGIDELLRAAKSASVSFALHYAESSDTWYVDIESATISENWFGKVNCFEIAIKQALDWVKSLQR